MYKYVDVNFSRKANRELNEVIPLNLPVIKPILNSTPKGRKPINGEHKVIYFGNDSLDMEPIEQVSILPKPVITLFSLQTKELNPI